MRYGFRRRPYGTLIFLPLVSPVNWPATISLGLGDATVEGLIVTMDERESCQRLPLASGIWGFTIGVSQRPRTIDYIKRQVEHHRKRSLEKEFVAFLSRHAIDYDAKYLRG
jgi:hypothetical protein